MIKREIETYPSKYPTPKYLLFMHEMLLNGWKVQLYTAEVSKYVFVSKDDLIFKIRFSNHKPRYSREIENDCDYYVGISHLQSKTTSEIIQIILEKYETERYQKQNQA